MKFKYILSFALSACLIAGCHSHSEHEGEEHDHDHGHKHEHSHEQEKAHKEKGEHEEGEDHDGHIVVEPAVAERFGVETTKLKPSPFSDVVKVSGRIMPSATDMSVVSAPTSGIVRFASGISDGAKVSSGTLIATISSKGVSGGDPNEGAKIAMESAKRELDRLAPLHADGIVTTKEFNAAKQLYEERKAAYSAPAASGRAVSLNSGVITRLAVRQGEFVEAGAPIAILSGSSRLTLRADLPEKYYDFLPLISTANFRPSYSNGITELSEVGGKLVSGSSSAAQGGYIPVYFSFENNGKAVPGSYAEVYLIGTTRQSAITVPLSAVTEQQGAHFVYVKCGDHEYENVSVDLGRDDGKNVEILSGLKEGDEVVTKGAITVKLAESSGNVPEGHSHNH